ncbi:xanthine dehydrogenase YagR molybdenum-binding subunit [Sphingomonas guangdongensis]|uniref:Xanthine dehydrogenase YagR molybdenum-binding subunit n=1 Tax=Sphingomonas guangdongensis TaxID=1141890 RepID=A0A285Q9W8_9SPHN|nr:xanthine dehydrogenase family protein molybdopterin-binding subunit [Sphingomonas guangdongensis]SOB78653.1 xanthine dehydrogenase YagR molybdenum-binding subunit [Sphingomonas guangdongensis]
MSEDTNTLTMDKPVEQSLLDTSVQELIGKPLDRIDGPAKVAGRATYAAEYGFDNLAYGFLVRAPFGFGDVDGLDTEAALALPDVIDVVSDVETFLRNSQQGGETKAPTQGVSRVDYFGQPLALVVAESYEAARDAAAAVRVRHSAGVGEWDFDGRLDEATTPPPSQIKPKTEQGDVEQGLTDAAFTIDATYATPSQNSAAMELHGSIATWDAEGKLTLYGALQMPASDRLQLADALGLKADQVRIVAKYVGGGFGSKLGIAPESVAAAVASKKLGRPVKVVMTRHQVFEATVRRSNTRQRVRLGADANGRLTTVSHENHVSNLPDEDYFEPVGVSTHFLYPGENRRVTHEQVVMNWTLAGSMRAPGEAVGMFAIEGAMDELAEQIGIDPVELRLRNEPEQDPEKKVPYSSRHLSQCLREGAERFGWSERSATPATRREGEWFVGMGVATATRTNMLQKSSARITLTPSGTALVETDMTDIGTGTYTILAQIAGELLGLPLDKVEVRLGDTDAPPGAGSGGSWGAGSSGTSVYLAAEQLRTQLAKAMDCDAEELTLKDGQAIARNHSRPLSELVGTGMSAVGTVRPGKAEKQSNQASYGAHFCEVRVNATTGEVRVSRWLSTVAAGRILNEKTARSQVIGGVTFGIGAALTEELVHDPRDGRIVNNDLAEYHVPVNADIPPLEVVFLPERDHWANPLHAKGLGELGISGAGAAVAAAIYNACGVRVRDFPITLDKLLPGLPPV